MNENRHDTQTETRERPKVSIFFPGMESNEAFHALRQQIVSFLSIFLFCSLMKTLFWRDRVMSLPLFPCFGVGVVAV